jgi:hypothetical protein
MNLYLFVTICLLDYLLTPLRWVLIDKLEFLWCSRNYQHSREPSSSLLRSQDSTTDPYSEPNELNPHSHIYVWNTPPPPHQRDLFPSHIPTKIFSLDRAVCPTYLILLDLVI